MNQVPWVILDGPAIFRHELPQDNIVIKATDTAKQVYIKISTRQIVQQTDHQCETEFWLQLRFDFIGGA